MIITIDTGGTKTLISSFSIAGKIGNQTKFPTPREYKQYTKQLKQVLTENYQPQDITAIVVALPGTFVNDIAVWCPNLGWTNVDMKKELAKIYPGVPVFVNNDANLAGLFETRALQPMPASSLYVTISTGIGTGFTTDGHINKGLERSEGGHALIEYDGLVQQWEKFASGKAIYKAYGMYAKDIKSKKIWYEVADRISRGFLAVIPIIQPDVIIIGGSIGTHFKNYSSTLSKLIDERLPENMPRPKIIQARYPEHAVIYGGYEYAKDQLANKQA